MYRFAAGPTQSRRWIFHADCLTRVATNGPYTTSTTPEPLEDQCWRVQTSGQRFGKSTREQIGALPPPYGRQLGSIIVREFQRLLRCSPAKRVFPSSCPHSLSTEAHRPSADLPSASFCLRAWLTRSTPCPLAGRELCPSRRPPPGKGLGLLVCTVRPSAISSEQR